MRSFKLFLLLLSPFSSLFASEHLFVKIKPHDTLLKVSFHYYGNFNKVDEIKSLNPGIKPLELEIGSSLKIRRPEKVYLWIAKGKPYKIKKGDTLLSISKKIYKGQDRVQELIENNKQLIKNKKILFVGFVLYYESAEVLL